MLVDHLDRRDRAGLDPFPGRDCPVVADQPESSSGHGSKLDAVEAWLDAHQIAKRPVVA